MDFEELKKIVTDIYNDTLSNKDGDVANYIPQLAKMNPELYGISVCTVNGEFFNIGDVSTRFCLQSCSKPINYCIATELRGYAKVHQHVGFEPSGRVFNAHALNDAGLPHNPMINAGAIIVSHLIETCKEPAERFETVKEYYNRMAGNIGEIGFDNGVFLSEQHHADRNISLAYYMRENGAFGEITPDEITHTLNLYFQCCSTTINSKIGSVMASTLANSGTCPITGDEVFKTDTVRDCLCLMFSCGMYDFSGQFAFEIGLPAKSGVAGCILLVIPNEMGICIFSPRLDKMGNSVRGVKFCKELIKRSPKKIHIFQSIFKDLDKSVHLEEVDDNNIIMLTQLLITSAANGDLESLQKLDGKIDFNTKDYDKRSALHLACAEGQIEAVKFLLEKGVKKECRDRWGNTAIHEANKRENEDVKKEIYDEIIRLLKD